MLEPITRTEQYLAKINGQTVTLPEPVTRTEQYLARAAGMPVDVPEPITRTEQYLLLLATTDTDKMESDTLPFAFTSNGANLRNYRIYGNDGGVGDYNSEVGKYLVPVTVQGKNLFNIDDFLSTLINPYRCTLSYTNGVLILVSASEEGDGFTYPYAVNNPGILKLYEYYVKPNTTYTLSWKSESNFNGDVYIFPNGIISPNFHAKNNKGFLTFTTKEDTQFISLRFDVIAEGTVSYTDIQLEESDAATDYEPYYDPTKTNIELETPLRKIGDELDYIDFRQQKQYRVRKNLLKNTATSTTVSGVTFTVNDDGSVTCNGTATVDINLFLNNSLNLPIGTYIMSLKSNKDIEVDPATFPVLIARNFGAYSYTNMNGNKAFNVINTTGQIIIQIRAGYVCDNLTFYPMIRKADIEDDTYEPYIEETEVPVSLPALPTVSGTNILTVDTETQPSKVYIQYRVDENG